MTETGNKPPGTFPPKLNFMASDVRNNNKLFDYNLDVASNFFKVAMKSPFCQQVIVAAVELCYSQDDIFSLVEGFRDALVTKTKFRDNKNRLKIGKSPSPEDGEFQVIVQYVLENCGITGMQAETLLEKARLEETVYEVQENTRRAAQRGAFGAPTFIISDSENGLEETLIFGSDRFEQIAYLCNKPYYGVNFQLNTENKSKL